MSARSLGTFAVLCVAFGMALVGGAGVPAAGAQAVTPVRLRLAMVAPRGSAWDRVARAWNRSLSEATGGTLELEVSPGSGAGDEGAFVRSMTGSSSTLEGAMLSSMGLSAIVPAARVLEAPGALDSYAELDRARAAVEADLDTLFAAENVVVLGWSDFGEASIYSTTPVRTPADLRGRHTWLHSGDAMTQALLRAAGGPTVELGVAQVLPGLTDGSIDTVVASASAVSGLTWHTALRHVTRPSVMFLVGATVLRRDTYLALSDAQRAALDETAAAAHATLSRTIRRDDARFREALTTTGGLTEADGSASAALWTAAFTQARDALVGSHYTRAMLDAVVAAGR